MHFSTPKHTRILFLKLKFFIPKFWLSTIWIAFILVLSLLPKNQFANPPFQGVDLLVHFGLYFIFSLLYLYESFKSAAFKGNPFKIKILLLFLTIIIGGSIEGLQEAFIPGRTGDILDMLFNLLGMLAGLLLFKRVNKVS